MIQRKGSCLRCGRCCRSFIILAGAMSDFKRAQDQYGLKLILNPDKKTYRCNMLTEDNLCKIHNDKPRACREAPRVPPPWKCGYKFIYINMQKHDIKRTKDALDFFEKLPKIKKMDNHTKQILERGKNEGQAR